MDIVSIYKTYQLFVAVLLGIIMQLLFTQNITFRVALLVIFSSIFISLEFIPLVLKYFNIICIDKQAGIYALSSFISLAIIKSVLRYAPAFIRVKFAKMLDLNIDEINKELENDKSK